MEKEIRKILFEYIFYAVLFSAVIILIGVPTVFGDPHGNEGKQALFLVYFIEVIYLVSTSIIFLLSLLCSIQNIYSNYCSGINVYDSDMTRHHLQQFDILQKEDDDAHSRLSSY